MEFNRVIYVMQAKAEREAKAAEGGWTVVVHHRGRKKTTDAESGVAVGSVAQAAVLDNMGKKKKKEVGLDFYRFQKKEAHRNGMWYYLCGKLFVIHCLRPVLDIFS